MLKAKVFISCGQKKDTHEVEIARSIANVLEELGFEPYIAVQEQTLRGLKENLFSQLASSEYFLFIDFKREQFANSSEFRGSLFSHQELAIASYLDLNVIAFQEKGVRTLDGMLGTIQANPIQFNDVARLPDMVCEQIKKAGWRPNWKNALSISRQSGERDDVNINGDPNLRAWYFHLMVKNLNPYKMATNCTAYAESIVMLPARHRVPMRTTELKWAGYTFPYANILPSSERQFDACLVLYREPNVLRFSSFADSGHFMPPIVGYGEFEITFLIASENFPPTRATMRATIGDTINAANLEAV